jgi:signal transduction histidine kinase
VHSIPIRLPDGQEGAVQIVRRLSEFDLWERNQLSTLGIFVPIACFIAGLGAFLIASIGLRPVRSMARTAQFISAQNLGARLPVQGSDELAQLGTSFNAVLDRLEDAFQRQRQFTADASHDLRTPLTRIRLLAQHRSDDPAELKKALEQCGNSAETLTRLVDQLLVLSRADSGGEWIRPTRTRASEVIAGALERLPETDRILTELPTDEPVVIWDQQAVSRVVSNLLENALSHSPPDTVVNLVVSWTPDWVTLIVKDSGEGIPEEKQEHIFSRFSRLDNARTETGHSGLGLAIVRAIAEAHGGQVFVSSQPNKGATFTLRLPFTAT